MSTPHDVPMNKVNHFWLVSFFASTFKGSFTILTANTGRKLFNEALDFIKSEYPNEPTLGLDSMSDLGEETDESN